jgi:chromosomal replication initiator protein
LSSLLATGSATSTPPIGLSLPATSAMSAKPSSHGKHPSHGRHAGPVQPDDIWSRVLGQLRAKHKRSVFESWFARIELVHAGDTTLQLAVPDDHFRAYIVEHWLDVLRSTVQAVAGQPLDVDLVLASELATPPIAQPSPSRMLPGDQGLLDLAPLMPGPDDAMPDGPGPHGVGFARAPLAGIGESTARESWPSEGVQPDPLASRFTFEQFVLGQANEFAATAGRTVAENPGLQYNPLFLYGGVGVGKTHLLHAIGHAARQRQPNLRVRYVAAETYIDDLHSAWRSKDGGARTDLRNLYRNQVDLLLVDDIQFLQGRDKVQDEFFHLFNALHQAGKQIVVTCDRFPTELQEFTQRLRSRFEWGLVAELTPPDRELRAAILRRKAQDGLLDVPLDVVHYLADHLRNNVRELEGALNKLAAHSQIGQRRIDMQLARSVLGPIIELPSRNLTVEVIQRTTATHFSLKVTDLKGSKRHRSIVVPRMIAIYLTRKLTSLSYPDIGRAFGGRDHSTAIHSCQKVEWMLTTDVAVQAAVQAIEMSLGR